MIDPKQNKAWVKIVAWALAIVFAVSFSFLLALPGGKSTSSKKTEPTENPAPTTSREMSPQEQVAALVGQGQLAAENGEFDEAISFFTDAIAIDSSNTIALEGLADAYFAKGKALQADDASASADAYRKSLETLPGGPKAEEITDILKDLETTTF